MNRDQWPDPILITGCARSGTSMTAGIIHMSGAWGGEMSGPTKYNQKGMFENGDIRNMIVKPYLRSMGVDPLGQNPLPNVNKLAPCPELRGLIHSVLARQRYDGGPWFYKCAKACLIWPAFHAAFPNARWVLVRREDKAIVASCKRTAFMRNRSTEAEWQEWVDEHKKRFAEMKAQPGLNVVAEIWPSVFVAGDFGPIRQVVADLGLFWNEARVRDFIQPSLYHQKE